MHGWGRRTVCVIPPCLNRDFQDERINQDKPPSCSSFHPMYPGSDILFRLNRDFQDERITRMNLLSCSSFHPTHPGSDILRLNQDFQDGRINQDKPPSCSSFHPTHPGSDKEVERTHHEKKARSHTPRDGDSGPRDIIHTLPPLLVGVETPINRFHF